MRQIHTDMSLMLIPQQYASGCEQKLNASDLNVTEKKLSEKLPTVNL